MKSHKQSFDDLVAFIETSVEQMTRDKLILQAFESSVSAKDISQERIKLLHGFLASGREEHLQKCLFRLNQVAADRDTLANEFRRLQHAHQIRVHKMTPENEELRRQCEGLESVLVSTEQNNSKSERKLRESLVRQKQAVMSFHSVIISAGRTCFLKQNISELQVAVAQMRCRQI
jgi:hypothetical protein